MSCACAELCVELFLSSFCLGVVLMMWCSTAAQTINPIKNVPKGHPRLLTRMKYETNNYYVFIKKKRSQFESNMYFPPPSQPMQVWD